MTDENQPAATPPSRDIKSTDDYTSRLLKLLPAEITGAYLAIRLVAPTETSSGDLPIAIFAVLILAISPWFMWGVLGMRHLKQIVFLMFSFVVWVANIEIARINEHAKFFEDWFTHLSFIGSVIGPVVGWVLSPIVIKGAAIIWLLLLSPLVFAKEALAVPRGGRTDEPKTGAADTSTNQPTPIAPVEAVS